MIARILSLSLCLLPFLILERAGSLMAEEGGKGRGKGKGHNKGSDDERGPAPKRQKPDRKASDEDAGESQRTEQPANTQDTSASSPASNEERTTTQPNREPPPDTTQETPSSATSTSASQSDAPPAAALPAPPVAPSPEAAAPLPPSAKSTDDLVPQGWESWTPDRRERWKSDYISSMETIGLYAEARGLTPAEKERWAQSLKEHAMKGGDLSATTREISKAVRTSKSKEEVMHE